MIVKITYLSQVPKTMHYLILIAFIALCNAIQKNSIYISIQKNFHIIPTICTSYTANTNTIMLVNSKTKMNLPSNKNEETLSLPDYDIPKWVYDKVFRHNKPNKYKFDK